MGEVTKFYPADAAKNPDNVLEQAVGVYDMVLIIGVDKESCIDVRASLNVDDRDALMLVERFKFNLLSGAYGGED